MKRFLVHFLNTDQRATATMEMFQTDVTMPRKLLAVVDMLKISQSFTVTFINSESFRITRIS